MSLASSAELAATVATSLLQTLYLLSPLIVAAALAAVVQRSNWLPRLHKPIDGGVMVCGKPLFGKGKTWRGLACAVIGSVLGVLIQKHLIGDAASFSLLRYRDINPYTLGSALGVAAVLGELPNSFAKRRLGIEAGSTARGPLAVLFYVWDQVDLLTAVWPALLPWLRPSPRQVAISVVLALVLHPTLSLLGYLLGARRTAR